MILRGSFPELHERPEIGRGRFFESYIQTYLDRDVSAIFGVEKLLEFQSFLELCAARTGQLLNLSNLARDASISVPTAREWIGILERTWQIVLLRPWHRSVSKRLIKTPKLHFLDTGLAAHLAKWETADTLMRSAVAGSFFETFVVSEIVKSYLCRGREPRFSFFRDREGHEVDLLIRGIGDAFHPVEIKLGASVGREDIRGVACLRKKIPHIGHGAVICLTDRPYGIDGETDALPVSAIG